MAHCKDCLLMAGIGGTFRCKAEVMKTYFSNEELLSTDPEFRNCVYFNDMDSDI